MCVRSIRSSDDDAYVSVDISQLHIATPFQDFNLKRSAFTSVHFSVFVFVCVCVCFVCGQEEVCLPVMSSENFNF